MLPLMWVVVIMGAGIQLIISFKVFNLQQNMILENIEELSLLKFDIGLKGLGDKDNEEAVMIIRQYQWAEDNSKMSFPFSFQASTCEM